MPDNDTTTDSTSSSTSTSTISATSAKNTTATTTTKKALDQRPIHTPYVTSYKKTKTSTGFALSSAVLKRYYSVIDAEIYFGNNFVEDIASIDWNLNQSIMPIFGYNSYIYDELARGTRIIGGYFDINFTSPNYLFNILKTAEESISTMTAYTTIQVESDSKAALDSSLSGVGIDGTNSAPIWPQTFDIDIIYGQNDDMGGTPVHILLEGVAIQSCQQVLSASAAESPPSIKERYSFLAQDIKTIG